MKKNLLFFLLLFIVFNVYSQSEKYDPQGVVQSNLKSLLNNKFGSNYEFYYFIIDSIRNHYKEDLTIDKFSDPYESLKSCILFYAYPDKDTEFILEDSAIIGIYKNNEILWYSNSILTGYSINLNYTGELNKDGKVEIVFSTREFKSCSVDRLWIISWDGATGEIINDYDEVSRMSKLVVWNYNFYDYDNDGIYEIISEIPDMCNIENWYPKDFLTVKDRITYGWNGIKYGLWPGIRQIKSNEFLPANRLEITSKCIVKFSNNIFTYSYTWNNDSSSEQSIGSIYLIPVDSIINTIAPPSKFNDWNTSNTELKLRIVLFG